MNDSKKIQIFAMGGGGFSNRKSELKLERYLLNQVASPTPKICFLPQASGEDKDYIVKFFETFQSLGAVPSWVSLFGRVETNWADKLLSQDIIYVGGGNTKSMLALWKAWGVDLVLKEAYHKGILLAGVSAGAICWFEEGVTDSVWPLGTLEGLGLVKGSCCPHFDSEPERAPKYRELINSREVRPGLALEDWTAVHFVDGAVGAIVAAAPDRKVYQMSLEKETILKSISL